MPKRKWDVNCYEASPPRYVALDRAGVAHATNQYGKGTAFCGYKLYNFHKRISLESAEWGNGYSYTPPADAKVTCLECLGQKGTKSP